ncbi:DUF2155 domain-containing protein [Terrarubrum flagellatum]|uniref:DUF2155 domain-containing protein n=1 Tax=Terrirubrum flagellatum TaxID=2895980 RepID=UPI003145024B
MRLISLLRAPIRASLAALALTIAVSAPAFADKIKNPTAVFSGLDKITGRIISFEVAIDETVQFGALQLTPRVCYSRPPTEPANSTTFVEVDEVTFANEYRRIFTGWMFAASPGISSIEHAIYDIWLTECKGGKDIIPEPKEPEVVAVAPRPQATLPQRQPNQNTDVARAERPKIDVAPQQGVLVQPVAPARRFFPTFSFGGGGGAGPDLSRDSGR